jgi:hypothetical protein
VAVGARLSHTAVTRTDDCDAVADPEGGHTTVRATPAREATTEPWLVRPVEPGENACVGRDREEG